MPVDSSATVSMPQRFNQAANSWRSGVKAWKVRTGWGSRSQGTATTCSLAPTSIPAAFGWRELKIDDIELEIGRPRTEAYIVYLFLMLRGLNGGCKDQHARLLLPGVH